MAPHTVHVVAMPLPAQGHINPLMELCKQIASKGATITFLNSDLNHLKILHSQSISPKQSPHSPFVPIFQSQGLDIRLMALGDGLPTHSLNPEELVLDATSPRMHAFVDNTVAKLIEQGDPPVTCLITDMRLSFSQDIANRYNIPRVAFWTQNAVNFAAHLMVANGHQMPSDDSTLITCIPGAPPTKRSELSVIFTVDSSHWLFDYGMVPFRRKEENAWILLNTFDDLEESAFKALRGSKLLPVGPLITSPFFDFSLNAQTDRPSVCLADTRAACLKWLDSQSPGSVLYVCFGTIAPKSAEQLNELGLGLEASGQPFLWVLRPDLMASASSLQPILDRTKHRGMVVPWAPQLDVLSHTSTGGFLTHCGWNSTLESIVKGVPMLTLPTFADQGLNARCIVDEWGVGLELKAEEDGCVSREEVEKKVKQLMKGGKEWIKACKLKAAASMAVAPGGSSNTNLELLVKWMQKQSFLNHQPFIHT